MYMKTFIKLYHFSAGLHIFKQPLLLTISHTQHCLFGATQRSSSKSEKKQLATLMKSQTDNIELVLMIYMLIDWFCSYQMERDISFPKN